MRTPARTITPVALVALALAAPAGAQEAPPPPPPEPPAALSLSARVLPGDGAPLRRLAVVAEGSAPRARTALFVSFDARREPCPLEPRDLPAEGGFALTDPAGNRREVGPGAFREEGVLSAPPGVARLCAYLVSDVDRPSVTEARAGLAAPVPADPLAPLTRAAVVDVLLGSPRVHGDVKLWILRGETLRRPGLGVYGAGVVGLAELTGDRRPEGLAGVSSGDGRVRAYYVVTTHGGRARVVVATRRARDAAVVPRRRGFRELVPRRGPGDRACCPRSLGVRDYRWNGTTFVRGPLRIVRR